MLRPGLLDGQPPPTMVSIVVCELTGENQETAIHGHTQGAPASDPIPVGTEKTGLLTSHRVNRMGKECEVETEGQSLRDTRGRRLLTCSSWPEL